MTSDEENVAPVGVNKSFLFDGVTEVETKLISTSSGLSIPWVSSHFLTNDVVKVVVGVVKVPEVVTFVVVETVGVGFVPGVPVDFGVVKVPVTVMIGLVVVVLSVPVVVDLLLDVVRGVVVSTDLDPVVVRLGVVRRVVVS